MSVFKELKNTLASGGNGLMRLVLVNAAVFLLVNISNALLKLSESGLNLTEWMGLHGNILRAAAQAWGLITYMFLHEDLLHILFNMLWLFWLGKIFSEYLGSKRLVGVYLLGGISGGLLFLVSAAAFPHLFHNSILLGASAGVMAVVIATAMLLPDYIIHLMFVGPVRLKYLALISFILTSILDLSQNTGGKISHIGGALFGMMFTLLYKKGADLTQPVTALLDGLAALFSGKQRIRVSYRRTVNDEDYNAGRKAKQEKLDAILDKISKAGYPSLTKEEKDFLFKQSGGKG